jgi:putative transposase
VERIKSAHAAGRGNYGGTKIRRRLRRDGERVSRERVARLMRGRGLRARRVKKSRRTTDSRHSLPVAGNVSARQFRTTRPGEVRTSDITYVWAAGGWL